MSMFESVASCGGRPMFSADSGPKSHACAPRSCQSKQFSQVECAGSSGRMTSPVLEGRAETKEKLFCHARGCLSEQVAQTASTAAWLCKNALRAGVSPRPRLERSRQSSGHGNTQYRRAGAAARATNDPTRDVPARGHSLVLAPEQTHRPRMRYPPPDAIDATKKEAKNRQPYPAPG